MCSLKSWVKDITLYKMLYIIDARLQHQWHHVPIFHQTACRLGGCDLHKKKMHFSHRDIFKQTCGAPMVLLRHGRRSTFTTYYLDIANVTISVSVWRKNTNRQVKEVNTFAKLPAMHLIVTNMKSTHAVPPSFMASKENETDNTLTFFSNNSCNQVTCLFRNHPNRIKARILMINITFFQIMINKESFSDFCFSLNIVLIF